MTSVFGKIKKCFQLYVYSLLALTNPIIVIGARMSAREKLILHHFGRETTSPDVHQSHKNMERSTENIQQLFILLWHTYTRQCPLFTESREKYGNVFAGKEVSIIWNYDYTHSAIFCDSISLVNFYSP